MLKVGQTDKKHDEHKDRDKSSQQALLSDKGITDDFIDSQLALVNKILLPKWFTKVKIVVSPDYHFTVIALIDSGADMNCIQEGLINVIVILMSNTNFRHVTYDFLFR